MDDQLIVHEGVTTTEDGTIVADIASLGDVADSSEVMDLSPDGTWAIFEGTVISSGVALQAAFTIQFGESMKEILGDVNCDGAVNLLDVQPFVDLLSNGEFSNKADINEDGAVNLLDVGPFVMILSGG